MRPALEYNRPLLLSLAWFTPEENLSSCLHNLIGFFVQASSFSQLLKKVLPIIRMSFLRKQESSFFQTFLDSRFRGSDGGVLFFSALLE